MSYIKLVAKKILYQPLFNALMFFVWVIPGHSVGWAIIILTIIVRLILLPSSLKASHSQKKLMLLQPKIKEIQEKYKDDKTAQSKAVMDFYKKNNVSPLGGCLPLLIQFPILIILYYVFIHGLDTSRFDLLYSWMPHPAYVNTKFFGLELAKPDKWILPIVTGALQFIQSRQTMPKKSSSSGIQGAFQNQMLFLMPIFTVLIAMRLPAALPLYWAVTTLFAIVQQYFVFGRNNEQEAQAVPNDSNTHRKGNVTVTVRKKTNDK